MIVSQENVIATEYTKLYWTFLVIHRYSPPGLPFRKRWHCQKSPSSIEKVHLYSCLVLDSFSSGQDVRTEMAKNLIHLSLVLYIYIYIYIYASTLYIYISGKGERESLINVIGYIWLALFPSAFFFYSSEFFNITER